MLQQNQIYFLFPSMIYAQNWQPMGSVVRIPPHLDALAASGIQFNRAYCAVPVCGASRASIMSGLRPTPKRFLWHHTQKDRDAPEVPSLPLWFKQHGYTTVSLGKMYHHLGDDLKAWSEEPWRAKSTVYGDYQNPTVQQAGAENARGTSRKKQRKKTSLDVSWPVDGKF